MTHTTGQNLIVDGSFEFDIKDGEMDDKTYKKTSAWETDNYSAFESWGNGYNGQKTDYGHNFIELDNGLANDSYSQFIKTTAGQDYELSIAALLRKGALESTSGVEILWNGVLIGRFTPNDSDHWTDFVFKLKGTGGLDKLTIREVDGQNDGIGALLDNVRLYAVDDSPKPQPETVYHDVAETQWIHGNTSNDVFSIHDSYLNYNVSKTQDGKGIVVWNGAKFDILYGVETLRFNDREFKADADGMFHLFDSPGKDPSGNGKVFQNVAGTQWIQGTVGHDVFNVGADSKDYGYGKTQDGKGIVVWKGDDFDILYNVEVIHFNDKDIDTSTII